MSYIKLNEVTLVNTSVEPNLLVEVDGEIKRLPAENLVTPQAQADWNETDATKPSYILNKPESLGGGKVITFTDNSGIFMDGVPATKQSILDEWDAGSVLRFATSSVDTSNIFNVSYTLDSGSNLPNSVTLRYLSDTGTVVSKTIY